MKKHLFLATFYLVIQNVVHAESFEITNMLGIPVEVALGNNENPPRGLATTVLQPNQHLETSVINRKHPQLLIRKQGNRDFTLFKLTPRSGKQTSVNIIDTGNGIQLEPELFAISNTNQRRIHNKGTIQPAIPPLMTEHKQETAEAINRHRQETAQGIHRIEKQLSDVKKDIDGLRQQLASLKRNHSKLQAQHEEHAKAMNAQHAAMLNEDEADVD